MGFFPYPAVFGGQKKSREPTSQGATQKLTISHQAKHQKWKNRFQATTFFSRNAKLLLVLWMVPKEFSFQLVQLVWETHSHRIHVWYIYLHVPYFNIKNNQT